MISPEEIHVVVKYSAPGGERKEDKGRKAVFNRP
jgi:hypothetical protein